MNRELKTTLTDLQLAKREGRKFGVLTCYDHATAQIMAAAGVRVILVGDTYGEVCLGHPSTLAVQLDHLLVVTEAVRRGAPNAYLIGDMPFLTYQVTPAEAIRNAGRFLAEAGCDAVKVEVDRRLVGTVEALAAASIPVIAHLGLRPQAVHTTGGYRAQGRDAASAAALIDDAQLMERAGAVALLLEAVPASVAQIVTGRTGLPVIGCVAGPHCDGTVVVMHDMLGYRAGHPPRGVKVYAQLHDTLAAAFGAFVEDVERGACPTAEDGISMIAGEWERLQQKLTSDEQATEVPVIESDEQAMVN